MQYVVPQFHLASTLQYGTVALFICNCTLRTIFSATRLFVDSLMFDALLYSLVCDHRMLAWVWTVALVVMFCVGVVWLGVSLEFKPCNAKVLVCSQPPPHYPLVHSHSTEQRCASRYGSSHYTAQHMHACVSVVCGTSVSVPCLGARTLTNCRCGFCCC